MTVLVDVNIAILFQLDRKGKFVVYKIGWIRWYKGFANFDKKIKELYRKNLDINKKL